MSVRRVLLSVFFGLVLFTGAFRAASVLAASGINKQISYQGKLLDSSGAAVSDGTYQMRFRLYSASSGGTTLWSASGTTALPTAIPVTVQGGLFSVMLGDSSAAGMWQNTLDDLDWNSDALYLGITIASDSEMTPRKRIGAVPQSFNSAQLQGMYASSSASGGQTIFAFNQTENNAATSSRTTLVVRSSGTSNANDYLLRGVNDQDASVFTLNRQGSVTSTGVFAFQGTGTSTIDGVAEIGRGVSTTVLEASGRVSLGDNITDFIYLNGSINSDVISSNDEVLSLGRQDRRWLTGFFTNVTSTYATSTYLYAANATLGALSATSLSAGALVWTNATGTNTTSTHLYASLLGFENAIGVNVTSTSLAVTGTATSTFAGNVSVTGNVSSTRAVVDSQFTVNGSSIFDGTATFNGGVTIGDILSDTVTINSRILGSLVPINNNAYDIGSASIQWRSGYFSNVSSTNATSTYLYAEQATVNSLTSTYATASRLAVIDDARIMPVSASAFTYLGGITATSSKQIVVNDRFAYVVNTSTNSISVFDVDTTSTPKLLAEGTPYGATIADVVVQNQVSYVLLNDGTLSLNRLYEGELALVGGLTDGNAVAVQGRTIYVTKSSGGLYIIDAGDPTRPRILTTFIDAGSLPSPQAIYVQDRYAYITNNDATKMLTVVDVSAPASPYIVGDVAATNGRVFTKGSYAYTVGDGFSIVNVFNPGTPEVTYSAVGFTTRDVAVEGSLAYVAAEDGVRIYDVSNKSSAVLLKTLTMDNAQRVSIRGRRLFVTDGAGTSVLRTYLLPGLETASLTAHAFEAGTLQVLTNGRIGNKLDVEGGLSVGKLGILSAGALAVSSADATSTILGNVLIGTSTVDNVMHAQFEMNGNDLFVGGNIGSASSVYTNGAFIAGPGSTYYGNGYVSSSIGLDITSNDGLSLSGSAVSISGNGGSISLNTNKQIVLQSGEGFMRPDVDGSIQLGSASYRFDGNFRNTTSSLAQIDNLTMTSATATYLSASRFQAPIYATSSLELMTTLTPSDPSMDGLRTSDRFAVTFGSMGGFDAYDIASSTRPVFLGNFAPTSGEVVDMRFSDRYVYVLTQMPNLLYAFDFTSGVVSELGSVDVPMGPVRVHVQGRYAYVLTGSALTAIDLSSAASMRTVGSVAVAGAPVDFWMNDRYAFVLQGSDVHAYDVSEPASMYEDSAAGIAAGAFQVIGQGSYAYSVSNSGLFITDVRVPGTLAAAGSLPTVTGDSMTMVGDYVFVSDGNDLSVVDVTNKIAPALVAKIYSLRLGAMTVHGEYLYGMTLDNEFKIFHLPSAKFTTASVGSLQAGVLQVMGDGRVGGALQVTGGLTVGTAGIATQGALVVRGAGVTSSFLGNLTVGTSTMEVAMHAQFSMNGDDLFVAGNIGSASSVYTNGAFIAGSGSTYYSAGSITNTDGSFNVTSTGSVNTHADANITLHAHAGNVSLIASGGGAIKLSATNVQPLADGTILGNEGLGLRFDGYFRAVTSTGRVLQALTSDTDLAVRSSISTLGSSVRDVEVSGDYMYSLQMNKVQVYDVRDKSNPVLLSETFVGASNIDVAVYGDRVYIVDYDTGSNGALYVVNVANKYAPVLEATVTGSGLGNPRAIEIQGRYAYVADEAFGTGGLAIFDLAGATTTRLLSLTPPAAGTSRDVAVVGSYAYVTEAGAKIMVYDVSNPKAPTLVGSPPSAGGFSPGGIVAHGGYLYVANLSSAQIRVFVATSTPSLIGSVAIPGSDFMISSNGLSVQGGYLYLGTEGSLHIFNVSNPSSPTLIQTLLVDADNTQAINAVRVSGRYAYVAKQSSAVEGVTIVDLGGTEVAQLRAHTAQADTLEVLGNGRIGRDLFVDGGLNVNQGIMVGGSSAIVVSSTSIGTSLVNRGNVSAYESSWGAYIDRLLIGTKAHATGTDLYSTVVAYEEGRNGVCILKDSKTCPTGLLTNYALVADTKMRAAAFEVGGFDLAERYPFTGAVTSTDVLVMDGTSPIHVKVSGGTAYDPHIIGIASSDPGLSLGYADMPGVPVALSGRVPTKVSAANGAIAIGDELTTSEYPGVAMKATKPGMIVGYALEAATATSTIEVFVKTGYSAGSILGTDGRVARLTDDLVVEARETATVSAPTQDSWGLTFRGSAWDGGSVSQPAFTLFTQVTTATSSALVVRNASSSNVFSIDQLGTATIAGDVVVGGRLYPSGRGSAQQSKYIFLDDTSTSTQYMATNADGWQANDSYDFAERYYSPDKLDMGDLVIASDRGQFHVQRSLNEGTMLMGIVSTRPAFVAGKPGPDTYPIALAGRVPTKVSTMNGAIKVGDALAPSSIPGTAVKATKAGPIVGLALERYDLATVGKIEVFVNPGWWGGPEEVAASPAESAPSSASVSVAQDGTTSYRGFAMIAAGSKRVHVAYDSVLSYPNVQATPRGQVHGGWWTDNYTDVGFDILLNDKQTRDITFTWSVQGTPNGARVFRSDGTYGLVNPTTGEAIMETAATTTEDVVPVAPPVVEPTVPAASTSTSTPVVEESPVITPAAPVSTETEAVPAPIVLPESAEVIPVEPSADNAPTEPPATGA